MLRALSSLCLGFASLILCVVKTEALVEIVEDQRCHDEEFRLTCRDLYSRIGIIEAWHNPGHTQAFQTPRAEMVVRNDDHELDRVYHYNSPKRDGVYRLSKATDVFSVKKFRERKAVSSQRSKSLESGCDGVRFVRSYAGSRVPSNAVFSLTENSTSLRAAFNDRCTGLNHCSFILSQDFPAAATLKSGTVYIKYVCFDDASSSHHCNSVVQVASSGINGEGYLHTPGYPHFYAGGCQWTLKAGAGQRLKITLLDVSLRGTGPFESNCTDSVVVRDSNEDTLACTCEQVSDPEVLISATGSVNVSVVARSQGAFPKRGLLLHYKSIGCVTPAAPSSGYMLYRNDVKAHYLCSNNLVFANTRQRACTIWCLHDNVWSENVSSCVDKEPASEIGRESIAPSTIGVLKMAHNTTNVIVDIVIPSLLIAALFIGNAFIVLIIYKYRKRKTDELEDELNTIPLSANGAAHTLGNAV